MRRLTAVTFLVCPLLMGAWVSEPGRAAGPDGSLFAQWLHYFTGTSGQGASDALGSGVGMRERETPPASEVLPMNEYQPGLDFVVEWSGDPAVTSYTIFVAENGGPFERWLTDTTETSAVFTGEQDATYEFYSIANGAGGLVEQPPLVPDTITSPGVVVASLDIAPSSCPNVLHRTSPDTLGVVLLGEIDLDVVDVDPLSVSIALVAGDVLIRPDGIPVLADASSPPALDPCDCDVLSGDGIRDLVFKFSIKKITVDLDLLGLDDGAVVEMVVTGRLGDGRSIMARDCVTMGQ